MPPLFSAGYSPITAAGTPTQIQHVARLLASQLTRAGVGPGVEQSKEEEVLEILIMIKNIDYAMILTCAKMFRFPR